MHSNLTAADVAKYVNAKILLFGNVLNQVAINFKEQELMLISESGSHGYWSNVSDCHLLLKPIQEISGEHVAELGRLLDEANSQDGTSREWGIDRMDEMGIIIKDVNDQYAIGVLISNNCEIVGVDQYDSPVPIIKVNTAIDYLRSKGYDMDNYLTSNKAKHA